MRYTVIHENRHKVSNALAQEDVTYENYLRLAESILSGKTKVVDLQDETEARKRMQEIDELRARGEKTEYELETHQNKKKYDTDNRKITNKKIVLEVTNTETGEKIMYKSLREFCDVTGASRSYIRKLFKEVQDNKIIYKRLIIQKIETDSLEVEIEPHRIYLNTNLDLKNYKTEWNDYEKAFMVQNRPQMMWKDIGIYLGRTLESCSTMLRRIKIEGKLDYYRNLDISDKFKL